MKIFLGVIGTILALPILLTMVALLVITLIGGYIGAILYWFGGFIIAVLFIVILVLIIKKLLD